MDFLRDRSNSLSLFIYIYKGMLEPKDLGSDTCGLCPALEEEERFYGKRS